MKKSSVVLAGVCACAIAAFTIDRFAVQRQLETLEREYRVVRAAKYAPESYPRPPLHTEQLASLLARNAESAPEPGANAPAADPGEETLEDAPPSQSDDEVGQGTRDQIAYVDAMFSNEPSDPRWARESERTIEAGLRERVGDSSVESVECRETLCKARVTHVDEAGFQGFVQRAFGPPRYWTGSVASLRDKEPGADGKIRNTIFYTKDGMDLPMLD
jgi:hypothetical protein